MEVATEMMNALLAWAAEHPGWMLIGGLGGAVAWWMMRPLEMWRLRQLPGSWAPPFLGHLPAAIQLGDIHDYCLLAAKRYPIASRYWFGANPVCMIHDPEVGRRALMKYHNRPSLEYLSMRWGEDHTTWYSGLLFINGPKSRTARKAFEAAVMQPKSLVAQAPFVAQCAAHFCANLQRYADSGEPVDTLPLCYMMALDAVGYAAFGFDLKASSSPPGSFGNSPATPAANGAPKGDAVASVQLASKGGKGGAAGGAEREWWKVHPLGSAEFGARLVECAVGVLKAMNVEVTSVYNVLPLFFPTLKPLIRMVASVLPDKAMRVEQEHYRGLLEACKLIVNNYRETKDDSDNSVAGDQGFLARLLSEATHGNGPDQLNDLEVIGNVIMMVAAGYETTGSSIASTLYLLAQNPEAQRKAQEELDAALGGKDVTPDDLERLPYLNAVVQESLRLKAAASVHVRDVSDDGFQLADGMWVPKGTYLLIPGLSFMSDARLWPRPLDFLPERHLDGPDNKDALGPMGKSQAAFLPFGAGSRMCVGYKFALLEARMALARVLQRFTFEPTPCVPKPQWKTSAAYSPDQIVLTVRSRASAAAK